MPILQCAQRAHGFSGCLLLGLALVRVTLAVYTTPFAGDLARYLERAAGNKTGSYLPPPSQDAWYSPPAGWQSAMPGDVLRLREHAYPTINIANAIDTFQVLYRTSDSHSTASWSVATVFIPSSHQLCIDVLDSVHIDCSHAMVTYAIPTDSADPDAAPSYLLQARDPYGEMGDMLARGWFVMVPDYEGPEASFCAGVQAGHAMLDASRAVLKVVGRYGFDMGRAKLGMWGYSGGSLAVEFAAELAGAYAPELVIDAAVVGGASPNVSSADERMNSAGTAGLVVMTLLGITVQQPAARAFLVEHLRAEGPFNASKFMSAAQMTGSDVLGAFSNEDIFAYFGNGRGDWQNAVLQAAFNDDSQMGLHGVPTMPMFFYKAEKDEISPGYETTAVVEALCRQGANILYHRNTVGGHNDELWIGRPRVLAYLTAQFEGVLGGLDGLALDIPKTGCAIRNVTIPLSGA